MQNNMLPIFAIDINLTMRCSFNCKYCFEKSYLNKKNTSDIDDKWIDTYISFFKYFLETNYFKQNFSAICLNMWGGEPTVRTDLIKKFFNALGNDNRVYIWIFSNGAKFSKELKNLILKYKDLAIGNREKLWIQISYDGVPVHNKWRVDVKGKPTINKTLKTIKWLSDNNARFGLKAVINPEDFKHLSEVFKDYCNVLSKYRINSAYAPTIEYVHELWKTKLMNKYTDELKTSLKQIILFLLEHPEYEKYFRWFTNSKALCSAGVNLMTLSEGKAYTCHGILYHTDTKDNVFFDFSKHNFDEVVERINKKRELHKHKQFIEPEECKNCEASICYKCNAVKFQVSKKKDYMDKWTDYLNQPELCKFYKTIGKYYLAYQKLKRRK